MVKSLKQQIKNRFPGFFASMYYYREKRKNKKTKFTKLSFGFTFMGTNAMKNETFEPIETEIILKNLNKTDVFVDIGANVGYFTCLALNKGIKTLSVEPLNDNLNILYENIKINEWNNVEVFPVGLAEKPGILELYGGGTGASLVTDWAGNSQLWKRSIAISTLDIILANRFLGKQLFIKIDVEGAEYNVLKGALNTINMSPKPKWLMEICFDEHLKEGLNPHFLDIFELFWENGYQATSIEKDSKIVTLEDVERWVNNGSRDFGSINYLFEEKK